jgi:hypothetical protein
MCNLEKCNTPFQVSKKCFGVNQLLLDTMKGITHDQKDGMKL